MGIHERTKKEIGMILRFVEKMSKHLHTLSGFLCLALVVLTLEQVVSRYFFSESSIAIQELQWHVFAAIFLLASAYALKNEDHVRVDILYARMSPATRLKIDTFGLVVFLIPSMTLLAYYGFEYTMQSRSYTGVNSATHPILAWLLQGEGSANPGGLPARWILKSFIPLFAVLNILQATLVILRRWRARGHNQ